MIAIFAPLRIVYTMTGSMQTRADSVHVATVAHQGRPVVVCTVSSRLQTIETGEYGRKYGIASATISTASPGMAGMASAAGSAAAPLAGSASTASAAPLPSSCRLGALTAMPRQWTRAPPAARWLLRAAPSSGDFVPRAAVCTSRDENMVWAGWGALCVCYMCSLATLHANHATSSSLLAPADSSTIPTRRKMSQLQKSTDATLHSG